VRAISPHELSVRPFTVFDKQWALLVAGSARPNPMTVSWGGLGTLWNRPVATVYVRPTRFTYSLLDAEPWFTVNFLPEALRTVPVPRVAEAELALECKILATLDLDPRRFLDRSADAFYPLSDYHRMFVGEVLAAFADEKYSGTQA
jgi:flavin reductase (DIM6/NTAB) family NADH-FMN oxidoreductase RutF